jgi:hypothetical protein
VVVVVVVVVVVMVVMMRTGFSHHDGYEVHLYVLSIGMSSCSTDYAHVLSAARLTLCIYIERLRYIIHAIL